MCLRRHRKTKQNILESGMRNHTRFLFMYSPIFKLTWIYPRRLWFVPNIKDIYFIRFVI